MSEMWPEINGKPAARVRNGVGEKIGLPGYSNVDLGPITVEIFVENTPKAIAAGLDQCAKLAEESLMREREKVLLAVGAQREASKT